MLTCKQSRVSCKNQIRFVGSLACLCSESFRGRDGNFAEVCVNLLFVAACCAYISCSSSVINCLVVLQLIFCEISGKFCLISNASNLSTYYFMDNYLLSVTLLEGKDRIK